MLLELAIGGAYGAGFEYADEMARTHNDLSNYVQHPRHRGTKPGMYTDDTQMSLAIAELIVDGADWTPLNIAGRIDGLEQGRYGHDYIRQLDQRLMQRVL